jgi:hypothetical protein
LTRDKAKTDVSVDIFCQISNVALAIDDLPTNKRGQEEHGVTKIPYNVSMTTPSQTIRPTLENPPIQFNDKDQ